MARRVFVPPAAPLPTGLQWWKSVRNNPAFDRVPLEAALSYPIPGVRAGALHFFHSGQNRDGSERRLLSRITAQLPELQIVEYRHGPDEDLFPGLPNSVPATHERVDPEVRRALFAIYPVLLDRYPRQPAGALGAQFLGALNGATPPELRPYYGALNPDFFDWLRRE
jgi:hypothetical protein